jgi:hypothetical protein
MYSSFGLSISRERIGEAVERFYDLSADSSLNKIKYIIFERPDNNVFLNFTSENIINDEIQAGVYDPFGCLTIPDFRNIEEVRPVINLLFSFEEPGRRVTACSDDVNENTGKYFCQEFWKERGRFG